MKTSLFFLPGKHRGERLKKWGRTALKLLALIFFIGVGVFVYFAKDLPNAQKLNEGQITQSTKIFDRTGKILLYDIHGEEKRTVIPFEEIPLSVKQATIAIEDSNFYQHFGLDFKGILRSFIYNVLGKKFLGQKTSVGGSTITQQFIKSALLSPEKTYTRKAKEAILAIEMELRYSKDEILSFYLNQVPYGSNAYGIEAAAQTFFNKNAKDLTLAESALLASLTQAPSYYSPYGSHTEMTKARQEYVLERMQKLGFISEEEFNAAKEEELKFSPIAASFKAPHFVMYIKEYLEEKYGQDYMENAGLKVYTTLDWDLQQAAEKIINEGAQANWKKYRARNAALVAIDPKTGQILAMVGSYDYFDTENDGNVNVAIRDRQPGSSFKPFAYVTAFQNGYAPETVLFDLATEYNPNCSADATQEKDQYGLDCYHPGNYDDLTRGPVTARQALAQSLNIPSVQMLYLAGVQETVKTAKSLGITTLNDPQRYGLALVLGGGEVKLLDEVAAYSVFANDGVKNEKTAILKIEDADGKILEEFESDPEKVLESNLARMVSNILSDNEARTPVFGANSYLHFADRQVAAKTGTTQGYRDAWTVGYTPSLAVGVWVGNNDNSAMAKSGAGIAAAGPLWHNFIKQAYQLKTETKESGEQETESAFRLPAEKETFPAPEESTTNKPILNGQYLNQKKIKTNKLTGQLADENTPTDLVEEKIINEIHNILYYVQRNDPLGDSPSSPWDDPQFANWEYAVLSWAKQHFGQSVNQPLPDETMTDPAKLPRITIASPIANQTISGNSFVFASQPQAPLGLKQVDYFLNNEFLGSTLASPHQLIITPNSGSPNGITTLKARVYDNYLNYQETEIKIFIER